MGCACSAATLGQPAQAWEARRIGVHCIRFQRVVQFTLSRENDRTLGLRLSLDRTAIIIYGIDEGSAMHRWNQQHPSMEVNCGDYILSVNGVKLEDTWSSWCDVLSEFRKGSVELIVARCPNRTRYSRRLRRYSASPKSLDHLLPADFMDSFPRETKGACNSSECPICLQTLEDDGENVQLPCRHAFHFNCAERWLTRCPTLLHARCPTCRAPLSWGPQSKKSADKPEVTDDSTMTASEGVADPAEDSPRTASS